MRERSRRASLQPELSVDAASDLETKTSGAPSARLSWIRITREYTQQQQVIVLGSNARFKKIPREAPRLFAARLESVGAGLDA